ncbi:MAG: hypothetical protein KatS3mg111_0734 [Pirellulaceae bacterium]|nr:MAG: hypothetical protein KatS3mg111_0734 [Pirellulaceae bacterium]
MVGPSSPVVLVDRVAGETLGTALGVEASLGRKSAPGCPCRGWRSQIGGAIE